MTTSIASGRLLRRTVLGSQATYRVVRDEGERVLVETVDAPGLEAGFRFHVTAQDAREMLVAEPRFERRSTLVLRDA